MIEFSCSAYFANWAVELVIDKENIRSCMRVCVYMLMCTDVRLFYHK